MLDLLAMFSLSLADLLTSSSASSPAMTGDKKTYDECVASKADSETPG